MYLPKAKYRIKTPPPDTYQTSEGTSYRGPVIETATGVVFQGDSLENIGGILTLVKKERVSLKIPFMEYIEPTEQDYKKGKYNRYILQVDRTKQVREVSKKQYMERKDDPGISSAIVEWKLIDIKNQEKTYTFNASVQNRKTLEKLAPKFPGIFILFKSSKQFVILK